MKKFLPIMAAALMTACASTHTAPRFVLPDLTPVAVAHEKAENHIESARDKAKQLEADVAPALKLQVASLELDLDNALRDLSTSKGSLDQLEVQLEQQTAQANKLAASYDKASAEITALKDSRHFYVKLLIAVCGLELLSLGWIFRKPLLLLAGL